MCTHTQMLKHSLHASYTHTYTTQKSSHPVWMAVLPRVLRAVYSHSPMKLSLTYVKNTQKWKGDNTVAVVAPSKDTHHALCGFLAPTLRASLVLWNGDFGLEALWKYNMHAWKCT